MKQKADPKIIVAAVACLLFLIGGLAYWATREPPVAKPSPTAQMSPTDYREKMQQSMEHSKNGTNSFQGGYQGGGNSGGGYMSGGMGGRPAPGSR